MAIYSLQVEKYVLSGLIRHPTSFADVESATVTLLMRFIILSFAFLKKRSIKASQLIRF